MKNIPIRHINTAQKEPDFSGSFAIRDVRGLLAGNDMIQELHRHDFFFILVLKKARGNHEIDFTPFEVCDNSVFFMRPGQVHQLSLKAGSTGYLMQFKNDFYYPHDKVANQVLNKASHTNFYQLRPNGVKKLLSILDYIFQEHNIRQQGFQEVIKANLGIFFIELVRQNGTSSRSKANPYTQDRLENLLELLETHIFSHKQVSDYAGMLSLSPFQLNTITKTELGKTCSQMINEYVILEAKRYLLASSGQIKEIADHLGYEDVSYFIRFFKKHTGYTPDTFRQNFR